MTDKEQDTFLVGVPKAEGRPAHAKLPRTIGHRGGRENQFTRISTSGTRPTAQKLTGISMQGMAASTSMVINPKATRMDTQNISREPFDLVSGSYNALKSLEPSDLAQKKYAEMIYNMKKKEDKNK